MTNPFQPPAVFHRWGHRLTATLVGLSLAATLAGCGSPEAPATQNSEDLPVVLTTFTVLADIAQNVAGDKLAVESITKVGAEIHGYEPTPQDIAKASKAQLILDNGLNLEAWFGQFVAEFEVPHVVLSDGIEVMDITEDADAGKPNPHAWMSPLNVQKYVANIRDAFIELDPDNREHYTNNAATYTAELQALQENLLAGLSGLTENERALVTCEGAFSYLARDVGLREKYIWAVNAEQQASPRQIVSVIEFVQENKVPAVFCESTVSDAPMQQVVQGSDAVFGGTLYVDSLSEADGPVPTYLDMIRHDSDVILEAMTGGTE
ncbi:metal ABC transporter substrate-binding protein [Paeniglutamicibacter gangotriensis]|uniref:Manganese ABC transporter, manganese-binding protein n=1 Tax=Paeniglutamicibacter gangotriensis Lz1y TaxID=1276920 RepID=M7NFG6_9MICC|nr:metal ABC transporter substrate-binding protein [Paeniglutamicibacter gangotriensis]EMR00575.1 manganese ABC transporter, manganese-binding protein [Paeniglutamicibacter gangotriensis Lz1y]